MQKKCTLCGDPAQYAIKGSTEFYCEECALENFGDLSYLITVEQQALELKKFVDKQINSVSEDLEDIKDTTKPDNSSETNQ